MTGTAIAIAVHQLPAPSRLNPENVARVRSDLYDLMRPLRDDVQAMRETQLGLSEKLPAARRLAASPLPDQLRPYAVALREQAETLPDPAFTLRSVALFVDHSPAWKPANLDAYCMAITESIVSRRYGPAIVALALEAIRETDASEFRRQLPVEYDFVQACERARNAMDTQAWSIERSSVEQERARQIVARAPEIEAAEAERRKPRPAPVIDLQRIFDQAEERIRRRQCALTDPLSPADRECLRRHTRPPPGY